ncbi:MAG: hypothetical protein AAB834_00990, partial [Patescibacteria group bacterium]
MYVEDAAIQKKLVAGKLIFVLRAKQPYVKLMERFKVIYFWLLMRPERHVLLVIVFSLLVNISLVMKGGVPAPSVNDEFSYLLAADTFSHGRLTNPPHPFREHFSSLHVIQEPSYASKYPPGQGIALALGQVLTGLPIVGVWISAALACAALAWMLSRWMTPQWGLLGGLLATIHPLMLRWGYGYWGGAVAVFGGALVLGAFRR